MSDIISPASQNPRAAAAIDDPAIVVEDAFLVLNGNGDWELDTTGPADGYWADAGSGGVTPDSGAVAHAAFFKRINGDYFVQ